MMIHELPTGDKVHRYNRCIVIPFSGKRKVMSTSMHNGGYREDLSAIFNHDVNPGPGRICEYCKPGNEWKIKKFIVEELGLDFDTVAYMATIVSMENAVIKTEVYEELSVTAISTASLEVNGGRVGEEGTCHERNGQSVSLRPGTINIMVFVNADMTQGCMARSIMTATEAKTAALQELIAGSLSSSGIATGSGTDNMMIIANSESDNVLTYAGKHSKLGELIGKTVINSVKEALDKHMGLSTKTQHSMLARLKRYGINEKSFITDIEKNCIEVEEKCGDREFIISDFIDYIHTIGQKEEIVTLTSLYVHLLDQVTWGLLSIEEAINCGNMILQDIAKCIGTCIEEQREYYLMEKNECIKLMLELFTHTINMGVNSNK